MNDNLDLKFKNVFNRLEKYVKEKYGSNIELSYDFLSTKTEFSNDVRFWLNYRDLRNIIVHNENVANITEKGLEEFTKRVEYIINPPVAHKVCVKNVFKTKNSKKLVDVIQTMKENDFSNVPVVNDDEEVEGIFSYYTLFLFFSDNRSGIVIEPTEMCIGDFKKYYGIKSNSDNEFEFIAKKADLKEINNKYKTILNKGKQMGALLVTESGKKNEKLLGIITVEDIVKENEKWYV